MLKIKKRKGYIFKVEMVKRLKFALNLRMLFQKLLKG